MLRLKSPSKKTFWIIQKIIQFLFENDPNFDLKILSIKLNAQRMLLLTFWMFENALSQIVF